MVNIMNLNFLNFLSYVFSSFHNILVVVLLSFVIVANGLSDAPNTIATCVSTRAISPKKAIIMSTIFTFLGIFIMSFISIEVVHTVFNLADFASSENNALLTLIGALISILLWVKIMNKYELPVSESHALIASLSGAAIAYSNSFSSLNVDELLKVFLGIVLSILLGVVVSFVLCKIVEFIFSNFDRRHTIKGFKCAQIFGGALMSFMHGAQSGQKFIGIFLLGFMLMGAGNELMISSIPVWLMIYCSFLMSIGILIGGYKVIKTVGMKLSCLELYQGAVADISAGSVLLLSTLFGFPISTSHTKSMSIVGVSACRRVSSINWNIIKNILLSGLVTFPFCGLFAYVLTKILLIIGV